MSIRSKIVTASIAGMLAIAVPMVSIQEGLSVVPYKDIGGVWTWCYGETEGKKPDHTMTAEECSFMLKTKLYIVGTAVFAMVDTPMTNERWAGLTSFTYNLGINAFRKSTLLKKLNSDDPRACDQIMRWTFIKGKDCSLKANKCSGIVNRRIKEHNLCLKQ